MGSRVRLGLNVGASEREITEEVGFEVLFSSLTDSVVDVLINLVISKEGETTNTKKKKKKEKKGETFYEEREAQQLRHKVVSINKCLTHPLRWQFLPVVALLALTCIRLLPNRTRMNQESMLT